MEPEQEEEEEEVVDFGGLLASLMTNEEGENLPTILSKVAKTLETQNKILIKMLTQMSQAS